MKEILNKYQALDIKNDDLYVIFHAVFDINIAKQISKNSHLLKKLIEVSINWIKR